MSVPFYDIYKNTEVTSLTYEPHSAALGCYMSAHLSFFGLADYFLPPLPCRRPPRRLSRTPGRRRRWGPGGGAPPASLSWTSATATAGTTATPPRVSVWPTCPPGGLHSLTVLHSPKLLAPPAPPPSSPVPCRSRAGGPRRSVCGGGLALPRLYLRFSAHRSVQLL